MRCARCGKDVGIPIVDPDGDFCDDCAEELDRLANECSYCQGSGGGRDELQCPYCHGSGHKPRPPVEEDPDEWRDRKRDDEAMRRADEEDERRNSGRKA